MLLPLLSVFSFFAGVLVTALAGVVVPEWAWAVLALAFVKNKKLALVGFVFLLGMLRMQVYSDGLQSELQPGSIELEGVIVAEVDVRSDKQNLTVETEQGRVLVSTTPYKEYEYGEWVKFSGNLKQPEAGSYANYLFRYGVLFTMNRAQVQAVEPAGFSLRGALYAFKGQLQRHINHLYFEPEASLVSGLLLGSRKGMPEDLTLDFQATGLTHIVVISGYNISLVIACVFGLFSFVPIKKRVWLSVVLIAVFVLFVGASAAAVRAGIMGSISMWGLYTGRRSQAFFGLVWSALLMTLWNPAILVYDIGFQLSFASTLGLLGFAPLFEKYFPYKGFIWEALLLTLSAQVATLPFIVFYFGRLSLISPLANLLVAPFLPFAMLFTALSLLCPPLALLGDVYTRAVIKIVQVLGELPFADIALTMTAQSFALTLFALVFVVFLFYKSKWARGFGLDRAPFFSTASNSSSQRHSKSPVYPASAAAKSSDACAPLNR